MHRYTQEEKDFLKSIAPGRSYDEITKLFNKRFQSNYLKSTVMSTCFRYGFKNGIDCHFNKGYEPTQFKKGIVPFNKGTKGIMKANRTSFAKGNKPANYRPVGSERVVDGYIEVKVADPKKWRAKHVVIWEAANGPVPKSHAVIFADGNRENLDLSNLILVSRAELAILNKNRLISDNAEITKTGVILANIHLGIGKRKQKNKPNKEILK